MQLYEVNIGGITHTVQLSDEEAKARGLSVKRPPEPKNKQRSVENKSTAPSK